MNIFDTLYIKMKCGISRAVSDFKKEERGVSNWVATVVMILIVVLLCAMFYDTIYNWFENIWQKIIDGSQLEKKAAIS